MMHGEGPYVKKRRKGHSDKEILRARNFGLYTYWPRLIVVINVDAHRSRS